MNQEKVSVNSANKKYDYTLMAPGPVNLHPKVREILSEPMIHHRTPEFDSILKRVLQNLKPVFQTQEPVFLISSTGSGGMEALLVNTLSPGDKVLAIVSGKFGERWSEMAKVFGADVDEIIVPWGDAVDVSLVKTHLDKKTYAAVLCQACETSTGVLHPIKELGALINSFPNTLFLVDGITALGAVELPMDNWHIDGLVGGSQKAFMLPTGLSLFSFSKKAQARWESATTPRFYFDVRKEAAANRKGETYFSSNVSIIKALDYVLNDLNIRGLNTIFNENKRRSDFTRQMMRSLGLCSFAKVQSHSLTAVALPKEIDGQKLREILETQFKITVMGGQDQAKGKIIRIGHMGYITDNDLIHLADAFYLGLSQLGYSSKIDHNNYLELLRQFLKDHP